MRENTTHAPSDPFEKDEHQDQHLRSPLLLMITKISVWPLTSDNQTTKSRESDRTLGVDSSILGLLKTSILLTILREHAAYCPLIQYRSGAASMM